ncbi:N-alpha-acetyltransferase 20 isoform X3 [Cygnus olor]|uniref:N-alpha-acetyltransferase 20 isoform X3 n=1 Tax=Cygnus olor TaxID=8869 RepID=UPI001ADE77B8|nr:N-alpha-acetyltransferase 20 isoform X3 [Cygnus olor]
MDCAVPRHAGSCSSVVRGRSFPEPGRGRAVRAGRRRSPLAASAVAGGEGRSSSPPLGPLRGLLPSEGGAPATPRKAAAGVLQPRVFQEKEQPDCPSCPGSCASVCLVPMAGVDDRSRAPKLLVLMLDVPLGKGPHPVCSAFLPYRVVHRRKALSREMEKELIIPLPHPVRPEDATRTQVLWIAGGKFTVRESKRARVLSAQWSHLGGTELLGWRCVLIL